MERGRRGPYKRFLRDPNVAVPRQTAWARAMPNDPRAPNLEEEEGVHYGEEMEVDSEAGSNSTHNSSSNDETSSDPGSEGEAPNQNVAYQQLRNNVGNGGDPSSNESSSNESSSDSDEADGIDVIGVEESDHDSDADGRDMLERREQDNQDHQDNAEEINIADNRYVRGPPLYFGCNLSRAESDILIMSFVVRWGLEDKSMTDLLQLIDCHLPVPVMGSKYLFLKKFPVPNVSKVRLTCSECFSLLPVGFQEGDCEHCGANLEGDKLRASGDFFLELSITEQLKTILQNDSVFGQLRRECQNRDVMTGSVYRALQAGGVLGDHDITLQWNTDGVSPFKSSKVQVWPIQACINELPYRTRRDNMILCGLYFGKRKPHIDTFLQPFVDELEQLHSDGFYCLLPRQVGRTLVKVHTILASVDSVARPVLQGIKQFNGSYGCSFCLRRGRRIVRGDGKARVYRGIARTESRSLVQHLRALDELTEHNDRNRRRLKHVQGVKRASVLLPLSVFNVTSSFVPDYMHCVLEGVVKQFLKHWINGEYKRSDWYLNKRKRALLSEKIMAVMPPVEITRAPRGLDDLHVMKASEFRHFLLYYSLPCLKGLLPARFLNHWLLLVYGITIYLKENFSEDEAALAKLALVKFVGEIENLYPHCIHLFTFNVHLLLHLPRAVQRFGGLWASSTFPFEHFNGVLARLITGTRHVPEQITKSYLRLRQISERGSMIFSDLNCSVKGKALYKSLLSKYRSSQLSQRLDDHLRFFGSPEIHHLSLIEKHAVQQIVNEGEIGPQAQSYRRMIFHGTVYHAGVFEALRVRNNSVVKLACNRIICITHILRVTVLPTHDLKCVVLGEQLDSLNEILCQDRQYNISSSSLLQVCRRANRIIGALPTSIIRKCVLVPYGDAECVIPLVNILERD